MVDCKKCGTPMIKVGEMQSSGTKYDQLKCKNCNKTEYRCAGVK